MLREKKGELPAFLKNKKDDKKEPDEDDDEKQEKLDKSGKKPKKPWEKDLKEDVLKETVNDVTWDKVEILKEALGVETLLEEIIRATEDFEMNDTLEHIAQQHDILLHGDPEDLESEDVYQDVSDEESILRR